MLRSRLADATLPGAQTPSLLVQPSQAKARGQGMVLVLLHEEPFVRQGGPLGITPQGPNWPHSPSSLEPSYDDNPGPPEGSMAIEVCAGLGPTDAEQKRDRLNVKGGPWASRPKGLTSHVAPHPLSL